MKHVTTLVLLSLVLLVNTGYGQSPSFQTFINPIIPGDHPDPTLTKIGDYFYSSGSSFNVTPRIYRSTNLVHWEVIAQPVPFDWSQYGNDPGGGIWGGHMVYHHGQYWHYYGRGGGAMYFVTADDPEGPWSRPTQMTIPDAYGPGGLGVDNSIFIDEDTGRWFLLTKAGHANNHMVELGEDGQPNGTVLDLTWLNAPSEPGADDYPYGWAEGPVMWHHGDYYYYSFAEHLVGEQYVMRSQTLTDDEEAWEVLDGNMYTGSRGVFDRPNHISPAVTLDDGTSWAIGHSYYVGNWYGQGRQGLLHEIVYNEDDWPIMTFPTNSAETAPALPSGGVPWMVPKSDMFEGSELDPEWSVLGYTDPSTISLTERSGWLYMEPFEGDNTVIKNDGEHNYSLITRVDFNPFLSSHEAGLWIFNGPETHQAKLASTARGGNPVIAFSFEDTYYDVPNDVGNEVWLKLVRDDHNLRGYYSDNGYEWTQVGESINATVLGESIPDSEFNAFTGNQQGLYVEGRSAFFDFYIYRDAYTDIKARHAINRYGTTRQSDFLGSINHNDWALYAGVEFGSPEEDAAYNKIPNQISLLASSNTSGGIAEVWLDSIDTGTKIAEVAIENTDGVNNYETFTAAIDADVSGRHDVYLRFTGDEGEQLFRLRSFRFHSALGTSARDELETPARFALDQNYPNPFNPTSVIRYELPVNTDVRLEVFDMLGRRVDVLVNSRMEAGQYSVDFDGSNLSSGMYIYRLQAGDFVQTRKMMLIK